MTVDEMNEIRRMLGLTYQKVSDAAGIPLSTVQKILEGRTKNPRSDTMRQLGEALNQLKYSYYYKLYGPLPYAPYDVWKNGTYGRSGEQADTLREPAGHYGTQAATPARHWYTRQERAAMPETPRTELIDGRLYTMESPSVAHQVTVSEIFAQIHSCIRTHKSACRVFIAPTDVMIDRDDYTALVPDIFIVCDRDKITARSIQGAPDCVMEVLSPSTRTVDQRDKFIKYLNGGVREYWMIDPDRQKVIVYNMMLDEDTDQGEGSEKPETARKNVDSMQGKPSTWDKNGYDVTVYGFRDKVPLLISDGKCVVDMNTVREALEELKNRAD